MEFDQELFGMQLTQAPDLESIQAALSREKVIRSVMATSGEDRQTVADIADAAQSMSQEAVLSLTDGEPTTLADALSRYVDALGSQSTEMHPDRVASDLNALLDYPWPMPHGVEELTREIHETYQRTAPRYGFETILWDDLTESQRTLALAVVHDLVTRGVISSI